mgnify:CR=1 FL=1
MKTEMKVPNECLYPTDVFLISCGMGCKRITDSEIAYIEAMKDNCIGISRACIASEKKEVTGKSQRLSILGYLVVTDFQEVLSCQCLWWILFLLR